MRVFSGCVLLVMETSLYDFLYKEGITKKTIDVLMEEEIVSLDIFAALKEQHFQLLLPKLRVGQHALVCRLHTKHAKRYPEVSGYILCINNNNYYYYEILSMIIILKAVSYNGSVRLFPTG